LLSDFGISIAAHDLWVPTFLPPKIPAKDARR
jgi:hypothetical protein